MNPKEIKKILSEKDKKDDTPTKTSPNDVMGKLLGAGILYLGFVAAIWGLYEWLHGIFSLPHLTIFEFWGLSVVVHWFTRMSFRDFVKNHVND